MFFFLELPRHTEPNWLLLITEMVTGLLVAFLGSRLWKHLTPVISYSCAFGTYSWTLMELIRSMDRSFSMKEVFVGSVIVSVLYMLVGFAKDCIATVAMVQFITCFALRFVISAAGFNISNGLRSMALIISLAVSSMIGFLALSTLKDKKHLYLLNAILTSITGTLLFVIGLSWLVAYFDANSLPWDLAVLLHPMPRPSLGMVMQLVTGLCLVFVSSLLQYFCFVKSKVKVSINKSIA